MNEPPIHLTSMSVGEAAGLSRASESLVMTGVFC